MSVIIVILLAIATLSLAGLATAAIILVLRGPIVAVGGDVATSQAISGTVTECTAHSSPGDDVMLRLDEVSSRLDRITSLLLEMMERVGEIERAAPDSKGPDATPAPPVVGKPKKVTPRTRRPPKAKTESAQAG